MFGRAEWRAKSIPRKCSISKIIDKVIDEFEMNDVNTVRDPYSTRNDRTDSEDYCTTAEKTPDNVCYNYKLYNYNGKMSINEHDHDDEINQVVGIHTYEETKDVTYNGPRINKDTSYSFRANCMSVESTNLYSDHVYTDNELPPRDASRPSCAESVYSCVTDDSTLSCTDCRVIVRNSCDEFNLASLSTVQRNYYERFRRSIHIFDPKGTNRKKRSESVIAINNRRHLPRTVGRSRASLGDLRDPNCDSIHDIRNGGKYEVDIGDESFPSLDDLYANVEVGYCCTMQPQL